MQIYEKKSVCQKNIEKLSQKNDRYLFLVILQQNILMKLLIFF